MLLISFVDIKILLKFGIERIVLEMVEQETRYFHEKQ